MSKRQREEPTKLGTGEDSNTQHTLLPSIRNWLRRPHFLLTRRDAKHKPVVQRSEDDEKEGASDGALGLG